MIKAMPNNQLGLTLVELMVAVTIGILILTGVTGVMITNKRMYKEQNEMGRLQENVRFAMEMILKDIRRAGYMGCMDRVTGVNSTVNGVSSDTFLLSLQNPIEGSESASTWYPSGSAEGLSEVNDLHVNPVDMLPDSDGISLKFFEPIGVSIRSPMPLVSAELKVDTVGPLQEGEIIAVTDCSTADVMQLTEIQTVSKSLQHNPGNTNPSPGNSTSSLSKTYGTDAEVVRLVARRYFVATSPVTGETALYMYAQDLKDFDNDGDTEEFISQELIEGVENMQILFGEDTAGDDTVADTYVDADAVGNWDNVVSARVSLLMRTIQQDFTAQINNKTYDLMGTTIDPVDDYRRRRVFASTIQIRNRANL